MVLFTKYDYYVDILSQYALVRGHMFHALMKQASYPEALTVYQEKRIQTTVDIAYGKEVFSGKFDVLVITNKTNEIQQAKLIDYKSTADIGHDLV
jgi:hypothetical protein